MIDIDCTANILKVTNIYNYVILKLENYETLEDKSIWDDAEVNLKLF